MTLLVRFVAPVSEWRQALQKRDAGQPMPAILMDAFIPTRSRGETKEISLYRLDDGLPDLRLAAAIYLSSKESYAMLAVEESVITGAGFRLASTPGKTEYDDVNARHLDVSVPTLPLAVQLADLFYQQGELREFVPQEVRIQVANDNQSGVLDVPAIAKKSKGGNFSARLNEIVAERAAILVP